MKNLPTWLRWAVPLAIVVALAPIPIVSTLEENDTFCIACHTAPEVAYHDRAQAALAGVEPSADLASDHYVASPPFRCIECHRGDGGLSHRAATLALGARDALIYLSGQADPTLEKTRAEAPNLLTAACVTCHTDSLLVAGFENHFHNKLPEAFEAWQANAEGAEAPQPSKTTVGCLDCHQAHKQTPGAELANFIDLDNVVLPACERCHMEDGHGPLELVQP